MGAIDIGTAAEVRDSGLIFQYTLIAASNQANDTGIINSVEIYSLVTKMEDTEVATFFNPQDSDLTTRDSELLGDVAIGSKQTFSGLDMDVETDDYIGCYYSAGYIYADVTGGSGMGYQTGDLIPCTDQEFLFAWDYEISLYGTGTTEGGGWANIGGVSGVDSANMAKMNSVPVANIAKVNGIAV